MQRCLINQLTKTGEYHFYLTIPTDSIDEVKRAFKYPEYVTLIPFPYDTSHTTNKYHFDVPSLQKYIEPYKRDYDLIINNEPALTPNFLQLFNNRNPFRLPIMDYIHWIETPQITGFGDNEHGNYAIWSLINGIRWSTVAFCNSEYGKSIIRPFYEKILSAPEVQIVEEKLKPLVIGIDTDELDSLKPEKEEHFSTPTIIFNHRITDYTGYRDVIKAIKELEDEVDFQIIFTNPSKFLGKGSVEELESAKFMHTTLSFPEYVKLLYKTDIVLGTHRGTNQWTLSAIEAMYCGNIPICINRAFYPELMKNQKRYLCELSEFKERIRYVIENIDEERKKVKSLKSFIYNNYSWNLRALEWKAIIENLVKNTEIYGTDEFIRNSIVELFKTKSIWTKEELYKALKWGTQIKWTSYRRLMLDNYIIIDDLKKENATFQFLGPTNQKTLGDF